MDDGRCFLTMDNLRKYDKKYKKKLCLMLQCCFDKCLSSVNLYPDL